jgi:hypothetical protein
MNLNAHKARNQNVPVLIKPRNYPFYYKIKKNLYIMQQLLSNETLMSEDSNADDFKNK